MIARDKFKVGQRVKLTAKGISALAKDRQPPGQVVTYDAQLLLNGPLRRLSGLLSPVFGRIAERATGGLVRVLDGTRLATTP